MKIFGQLRKSEKGQSMVEFALILPILLMLLLGIIEFGWLLNGKITLNASAREGARTYVVSTDIEQAKDIVISNTNLSGLQVERDSVIISDEVSESGRDMGVVIVNANMKPILGLFVRNDMAMQSISKMLLE